MAAVAGASAARWVPRSLTLLYDDSCPLCRTLRGFLTTRRPIVPMTLLAVGSSAAVARFPSLDQVRAREVLTLIDDIGNVYEGDAAFLMCAWALPGLRGVSSAFASGARRRVFAGVMHGVDVVRQLGREDAPYPADDGSAHVLDPCSSGACPVGLPGAIAFDSRGDERNC